MDIYFLSNRKLSPFIKDCIKVSIVFFGEELSAKISSPENKGLHNIYESSTRLEKKDADILHSIIEKILWTEKRVRPNIETAISFLCTSVTKITKEEKSKLR